MSNAVVTTLKWPPDMQERFDNKTPEELREWLVAIAGFDRRERRKHNRDRKNRLRDFGPEGDPGPYKTFNEECWNGYYYLRHDSSNYALLGLEPDADPTKKDIRNAYRRMSRKLHPDVGGDAEAFKAMHAAYRALLKLAKN